jgi:gamma-glutamyltranspeptidase/glutathione hydrolase
MTMTLRTPVLLACLLALAACQPATQKSDQAPASVVAPAGTADIGAGVAAANPIAVEAGLEILRAGGSAIDAAVAVQAALGLVEPQSSGLGGGAFLLHYDAQSRRITAYDGREAAPAGATPDMFLDEQGQPLPYADAVTSGRATGVPGAMAMLGVAQRQHGQLPWSSLFRGVEHIADEGFVVPKRLARFAGSDFRQATLPDAQAMFGKPDGSRVQAGDTLRNPAYAATLRQLAERGPRALLEPPIADEIIARTHAEPRPGTLAPADFAAYRPRLSDPLCRPYRVYVVCVPPPPSSGVALLQLLAILEQTDIAKRGPADPQAWFLFAEASRLMYADRDRYIADPAFVAVPVEALLDPRYVASRARLIGERAGAPPVAGEPLQLAAASRFGADATAEVAGTSHFVVVDAAGDVVSMTTSVESLFGSSMSPVIVLDRNGRVLAALGSPGGSAILAYNAKALVGLLAWQLPLQQAIELPNLIARGKDFGGEAAKFPPEVLAGLAARGVEVKPGRGEESGLHGVVLRAAGRPEGAADPRREGVWRQP